jgi:hypothetical protein
MRSRSEMKLESTLSSVVLPAPVPPLMSMLSRARDAVLEELEHRLRQRPGPDEVLRLQALGRKRRIESSGPSTASGGMMR